MDYEFTNDWFQRTAAFYWGRLLESEKPEKILEIGSFEGASTCYLIENAKQPKIEIHCVDTWQGGVEHGREDMSSVEIRFLKNTQKAIEESDSKINLTIHKGLSTFGLAKLLSEGKAGHYDFAYVDGSHQAPDVMYDALLAFQLVRIGGLIVFDDYLWKFYGPAGLDPLMAPKIAIDAFTNIYSRKVEVLNMPMTQQCIRKISD